MNRRRPSWRALAHPVAISGSILRAPLPHLQIGELCRIQRSAADETLVGEGTVVAVEQGHASIGLLRDSAGLSVQCLVVPTGSPPVVHVSADLLGAVLDARGKVVERLAPATGGGGWWCGLQGGGSDYRDRAEIQTPLCTGIRAIDALLTCGEGQRVGIFAAAGAGKTTLAEMLLENADVDVSVVALIGERGREVASLVERLRGSAQAARTVVIQATSDTAPALRSQAAQLAATVAETFRDQGLRVLLLMDSVTRYARALRELALGTGELPARRGFPASVFEALPRLMERGGRTTVGSITTFYTVLLEDEHDGDPIGEEVKSLLDGHLYLSSTLAGRGHFPALDILRSSSRLFARLADPRQQHAAQRVRSLLGTLDELRLVRELGEYRPGASAHYDAAVNAEPDLMGFLRQPLDHASRWDHSQEALHALVR